MAKIRLTRTEMMVVEFYIWAKKSKRQIKALINRLMLYRIKEKIASQ